MTQGRRLRALYTAGIIAQRSGSKWYDRNLDQDMKSGSGSDSRSVCENSLCRLDADANNVHMIASYHRKKDKENVRKRHCYVNREQKKCLPVPLLESIDRIDISALVVKVQIPWVDFIVFRASFTGSSTLQDEDHHIRKTKSFVVRITHALSIGISNERVGCFRRE